MLEMFGKDKQKNTPFELDWGQVTPEKYNESTNEAFYVCNFKMIGEEARDFAKLFLSAKVIWYSNHLPSGASHRIRMDIRGQIIAFSKLGAWKADLLKSIADEQKDIVVKIEFHTN